MQEAYEKIANLEFVKSIGFFETQDNINEFAKISAMLIEIEVSDNRNEYSVAAIWKGSQYRDISTEIVESYDKGLEMLEGYGYALCEEIPERFSTKIFSLISFIANQMWETDVIPNELVENVIKLVNKWRKNGYR